MIIGLLGITENCVVLWMFCKNWSDLKSSTSALIVSLAISDLLLAAIGGSMESSSSLKHWWLYGDFGKVDTL